MAWSLTCRPCHELRQGRDREAVRLLAADAHAQRVGQSIGPDLAQDDAPRGQRLVGLRSGPAFAVREMDEDEIRRAWRHVESELADFSRQPGAPLLIVSD